MVRLKEEANIGVVLSELGIPCTKKGFNYFLVCPNPEHNDRHATNCYFKDGWNNVYCTVCNRSYKAIDIIMWNRGYDENEAGNLLWQIEGCPEWYKNENEQYHSKPHLNLSKEEYSAIFMKPVGSVSCYKSCSDQKDALGFGEEYDPREIDSYVKIQRVRLSWEDFMSEKQFAYLVKKKAKDAMDYYSQFEQDERIQSFLNICKDVLKKVKYFFDDLMYYENSNS